MFKKWVSLAWIVYLDLRLIILYWLREKLFSNPPFYCLRGYNGYTILWTTWPKAVVSSGSYEISCLGDFWVDLLCFQDHCLLHLNCTPIGKSRKLTHSNKGLIRGTPNKKLAKNLTRSGSKVIQLWSYLN